MMFDIYDDIPIGIDLGTTNSCIGFWNGKEVKIVPNRIGEKTTPSVLYFLNDKKEYLVGEQSQKYLSLQCQKIYSIKRIIGREFDEIKNELNFFNYDIIKDNKNNRPLVPITQEGKKIMYDPETLSSFVLKKLVKDAEKLLVKPIKKAVISVPAYFDDAQRCATIEAARRANLEVIRIINEPTAAALSYGLGQNFCPFKNEIPSFSDLFRKNREIRRKFPSFQNNSFCLIEENKILNLKKSKLDLSNDKIEKGKNIMIFDLGGGTYDLAILQLNLDKKEYEVKSKISDKYLGGDDFDNKLVDYCLIKNGFNRNNSAISLKSIERLRNACEQAKKKLSLRDEIQIQVNNFKDRDIIIKVTRAQFENEICGDLFDRLEKPFNKLLKGANLTYDKIEEIILVGGSTRMPKIKKIINKCFPNIPINEDINPDEVVAYGATIQAAMLMTIGKSKTLNGIKLYDITPISLGTDVVNKSSDPKIKALGSKMSIIIPKWSRIPIIKEKGYKTVDDNQKTMQICIYEGENDYLKDNKFLNVFTLLNLPPRPRGQVQCTVSFEIDVNNILNVTATETSKGIKKKIKVEASNKVYKIKKSIASISTSQMVEEKNKFDKVNCNIEEYINKYTNTNEINKKIKILENYNIIIQKSIDNINPNESEEGINADNVEKYFFYVYQLFESYEEMLNLKMDDNIKNDKKNYIVNRVKKFINIFKRQNSYYIKQFIELFQDIDNNSFLEIFLESIQKFNEMGQYYLNNTLKFSRYYSKLYFEEVINLSKKYKILNNEGLYDPFTLSSVKEEIKKSEIILTDINTNAIALIMKLNKEKKIVNSNEISNKNLDVLKNWETGFTYIKNKINIDKNTLTSDEYNIILDELEKMSSELEILILQSNENEEIQADLLEQQGICLANIVKIKYSYFKGQYFSNYLKLMEKCLFYASRCNKDNSSVKWYQDALELKNEIEEKNNDLNKQILYNTQEEINTIDSYFNQNDKINFINYILEKWPYKGYNKYNRPSYYNWNEINKELITFLSKQYHPDSYPKNTKEERFKFAIIGHISAKLNNILESFTPESSGVFGRQYVLK